MSSSPEGWWKTAVTYQVYPRSFADSNGDGSGDLRGIIEHLDYLEQLGVDALWLGPFYPSGGVDGGYDVVDYCAVDPLYGSLGELDALLDGAHARGLRVIIDLIPNHSSAEHPLFQAALRASPGSPERNLFHFHDGIGEDGREPPNNWRSVFGGSSWTQTPDHDGRPGQWYYHLFAPEQPDFNWENPRVLAYFEAVIRFWLDRGVDGFRIDVSDALIKDRNWPDTEDGSPLIPKGEESPVHDIYRRFRQILNEYEGAMAVIETGADDATVALFLRPDEMHQAFNFRFLKTGWDSGQIARAIDESMLAYEAVGAPTTWVTDNHDTTRSVTRYREESGLAGAYVPTAIDPFGTKEIAIAVTDPQSDVGVDRARAMAVLLLSLPGSAYIYAGQELGLPEVVDLPDAVRTDPAFFRSKGEVLGRDGCRIPLPWGGECPPFDFGDSPETWLPQPEDWASLSVERQSSNPESMLELYRQLLRTRRDEPSLGSGTLHWVRSVEETAASGLLHLRFTSERGDPIDLIMNFTDQAASVDDAAGLLLASAPLEGAQLRPNSCALFRTSPTCGRPRCERSSRF